MANSKRNMIKTLEFDSPVEIPTQLWELPWADLHYPKELAVIREKFPNDILNSPDIIIEKPIKIKGAPYEIGEYTDEWGCLFENRQAGIIGEVKNPILKSWDNIDQFQPPNELLMIEHEKINDFCKINSEKFIISPCCARPFERIQFLRGTENVFMDFYENKYEFNTLLKIIHEFNCKRLESWSKTNVDALFIMDDWGSQNSLLINPEMWREIFKPLYLEYVDIARRNNKYIFMHCDGNILSIIPDLVEIGINALNSQVFAMGIKNLAEFKGKITFWGEIDRQNILSNYDEIEVKNEVVDVFKELYSNGGIIGQCEFGPGAKPENVYTVFDTWKKCLIHS